MPRIKIAQLVQSGGSANDPAVIVNLRPDQQAMATGLMAGCCSAILLWNATDDDADDANGAYESMRGHHADADPANIDWTNLLRGVPNDPAKARLIIACARDNLDPNHHYNYRTKVLTALDASAVPPILFDDGHACSLTPYFYGFSDLLVFRNGIVIELNGSDYAEYDVG